MQAYDWMVKYTPQTEWVQRRGVLLWLAFFFIELGAGTYILASVFGNFPAMLTGWLICALLGGGLHLLFLGKPLRTWRMLFSSGWKTSWLSRGLAFVAAFLVLGLIEVVMYSASIPHAGLAIATAIVAFLTIIYGGFAMNFVNGIPLWNTYLLPVLYMISGLWGGAELTMGIGLAGSIGPDVEALEFWIRIFLIGFILLTAVYLISIKFLSQTGSVSVRQIVAGKFAGIFWVIVWVVGIIIPASIVFISFASGLKAVPPVFYYLGILAGMAGDLTLRYLILKCGLYAPLISTNALLPSK